jgi:hypothetical protein
MLLLDTDVMVDVLRRYPAAVEWLAALGETPVGLPGLVSTILSPTISATTWACSMRSLRKPWSVSAGN